ncbi:sugar ABC transporter substrate-binding protein [Paracoccus sp. (in: a-proteobacteria)]|uniref:sugar ABC transporter substrate-binding protein n=1 Tax=Paracoccus sp. TaxID=267 RepID=UPI003A86811B
MKLARKLAMSAALAVATGGTAMAQDGLSIVFTHHSSSSNTFWQAVKKGYDDACARVGADCQMVFTQTEGSIEQQLANMEAALARQPDALITSIVDNDAFDDVIQRAVDNGVIVIAANVDDLEGAKGNARAAFIGQGFRPAGHALGQAISGHFPAEGPIHVLVGISAPGQNWSEQRGGGVMDFLEEYKAANPDREITFERIDSGTDMAVTADRVGAYLSAHPETTAYFDTGLWHSAVAQVLKDRGIEPGKVLLGGFDLVPDVIDRMRDGYIQAEVDQQPYMQGFMPVMSVYLAKTVGLAPADIDTGQGIATPADAEEIAELSAKGLR